MFGLTFVQLGYAFPAFLLIVGIVLKSGLPFKVSVALSLPIIGGTVFFMFFDGTAKLKHIVNYVRNNEVNVMSKQLTEIIDIQKIEHDMIVQKHAKLAVLEVIPMNFMLKPDPEKESILVGFSKFLNSLDFPVQIYITSTPLKLGKHLTQVAETIRAKKEHLNANSHLSEQEKQEQERQFTRLLDSYCRFVHTLFVKPLVKNRNFYLIIKEKDNLALQVEICTEKLQSIGLKVQRLSTPELVQTCKRLIANDHDKRLQTEAADPLAHFLYAPAKVVFQPELYQSDHVLSKVLAVTGYPHAVEMGFLDKILSSGDAYDVSLHIEPFPIDLTMVQLNRDLQKQQADLYSDSQKGIVNLSLDIKFASTKKVLEDLQKGRQKLFNVSFYLACKGTQKQDVEALARKLKADLDALMLQSSVPLFQAMEAYTSMLPLAKDALQIKRNVHSEGLAAFFPFSSPFLDMQNNGVLLGINKNTIPIIKNVFALTNANGVILATSGAGKSYFTKLFLSRQYLNDTDVIIIDPQSEYVAITQQYHGECITLSKHSATMINPLDLMEYDYLEKRLSLMDLMQIMFGSLNELQKSILDHALDLTYKNKKITKESDRAWEPPIMSDLFTVLQTLEKRAVQQEKMTYRALLNRAQMFTKNGVFGFMDRHTTINFSKSFVCFNIGSMPKQVKPVIMYLILEYVYLKMKQTKRKKLLVIDEAWSLLQTAEESSYIFEIVKTCRKFNLGLVLITQDVADLVDSKAGHAVLANSSYTFLLRQKPAVIQSVVQTFNLSAAEKTYLLSAKPGTGILILENEHQELEVVASPEEHRLVTTNPNEIIVEQQKPAVSEPKPSVFDVPVYADDNLSLMTRNTLHNNGYVLKRFHNLHTGPKPYFVKALHPESIDHVFLVHIIAEEIKRYTDQIWIKRTCEPDIVFINKAGQEIALEIETGKGFDKHNERLDQKFSAVREKYGDRVYIVLTDNNLRNSYVKYDLLILLRNNLADFIHLQFSGKSNAIIGAKIKGNKQRILDPERL